MKDYKDTNLSNKIITEFPILHSKAKGHTSEIKYAYKLNSDLQTKSSTVKSCTTKFNLFHEQARFMICSFCKSIFPTSTKRKQSECWEK